MVEVLDKKVPHNKNWIVNFFKIVTEKVRDEKKLVFTKPISEKLPFQSASLAILDISFIIIIFFFVRHAPNFKILRRQLVY